MRTGEKPSVIEGSRPLTRLAVFTWVWCMFNAASNQFSVKLNQFNETQSSLFKTSSSKQPGLNYNPASQRGKILCKP